MDFSATLEAPSGWVTSQVQLASGKSAQADPRYGRLTVATQADMKHLLGQGWSLVTVTHATPGGNQG
jgi:hypothetical protein